MLMRLRPKAWNTFGNILISKQPSMRPSAHVQIAYSESHQISWPDIMSEMDHRYKVTCVIWSWNFHQRVLLTNKVDSEVVFSWYNQNLVSCQSIYTDQLTKVMVSLIVIFQGGTTAASFNLAFRRGWYSPKVLRRGIR